MKKPKIGLVLACSAGRGAQLDVRVPPDVTIVPVYGGAALTPPPLAFVGHRDDEGENGFTGWSVLNPFINECTAFHWAGRNLDKCGLGDADYIGTGHYRRVIDFDTGRLGRDVETAGVWHRLRREAWCPDRIRFPLPADPGVGRRAQFRRFFALERFVSQSAVSEEERISMDRYFRTADMGFMRSMFYMPRQAFLDEYIPFLDRFVPLVLGVVGYDGRNAGYVMEQLFSWWFSRRFPGSAKCRFLEGADGVDHPALYR